jgi:hypothetical protein
MDMKNGILGKRVFFINFNLSKSFLLSVSNHELLHLHPHPATVVLGRVDGHNNGPEQESTFSGRVKEADLEKLHLYIFFSRLF